MAQSSNPTTSNEVPTQPQEPAPPVSTAASTSAPVPSDLEAREKAVAIREAAADATLARAEAVAKSVEDSLKKASEISAGAQAADTTSQVSAQEKANIVTLLIQKAFSDKELGEVVPFTPAITMANNTSAGLITFEAGVEYQLPKDIVDDLVDRQSYYGRYKENLHIRTVVSQEVGQISGAGK